MVSSRLVGRGDSMTSCGDHHLRQLQHGVISGGERPVIGQAGERGVLQITFHDRPQIILLRLARGMPLHSTGLQ